MTPAQLIRKSTVGKKVGNTLYVHWDSSDFLPQELRELIVDALEIARADVDTERTTLVKIDGTTLVVSFLEYEDFDSSPHPALLRSVTVNTTNGNVRVGNYQYNRPILHRKETFVAPGYPGREVFAALTADEEAAGLLGRNDIGREDQWADVLEAAGLQVIGHTLVGA